MSTSDAGPGGGSDGDEPPAVWGDVTDRQPERDVPEPAADAYAVPPRDPNAPPPAAPTEEQLRAGQPEFRRPAGPPASGAPPYQGNQPAPGGPIFVNPDQVAAAAQGIPTFVRPGGQPVTSVQPHPGGPVFVQPGGTPVPVAPGMPIPVGQPVPGGPVFVAPSPGESPVDRDHPWGWWVGPVGFGVAFGAVIVLGIVLAIIGSLTDAGAQGFVEDNEEWAGILQDAIWVGVVLLIPFWVAGHLRPGQLGLRKAPLGRAVLILIGAFIAFYIFQALYAVALGLDETSNEALQDTGFGDGVGRDILYALLFTVAAPVAEELLFRGLLFRTIRDGLIRAWGPRGGLAGGAIISGIVFGGVHIGGGQDKFLPVLMAFGAVLALTYHWSGTLYVPIALHAINNAIATGFSSDPSADWIYGLIALGPVIAVLTAVLIAKFIRKVFPSEPSHPAPPHAAQHATL